MAIKVTIRVLSFHKDYFKGVGVERPRACPNLTIKHRAKGCFLDATLIPWPLGFRV